MLFVITTLAIAILKNSSYKILPLYNEYNSEIVMLIEMAGTSYNMRRQKILNVFLFKYAMTYVKHNNCVVSVTHQ